MAQAWESEEIRRQGELYNQAKARGDKAGMEAARAEAERLRNLQGYKTDASGLNQTALPGYVADSTNTKFTKIEEQPQVTQTPSVNIADLIDQQAREQMAAQAAAIQAARDKQVREYESQISQAGQIYNPLKNQASYQGAKALQAANERAAAMGIYNSGDNITAGIQVNAATQKSINDLNIQEQNYINQLRKAIADANSAADAQTLQSNAEINAQRLQALINQANADREYELNYAATQANIANTNANTIYQNLVNAGYPAEQAAKMAQAAADLRATQLANEAQEIANKYAPQIAQGQIDEQKLKNKYQELVNNGYNKQLAADLAVAYANVRQSNASASAALQNAATNAAQLQYQKQRDAIEQQNDTYNKYLSIGLDMKNAGTKDSFGNFIPRYTDAQIKQWVLGLPVDDATAAKLLSALGV